MRPHHLLDLILICLFAIGCSGAGEELSAPTSGALRVVTTTSGGQPDTDGYTILLDGTDSSSIGMSATATLSALSPGAHHVGLGGLAANCSVVGESPRTVSIVAGVEATVRFAVNCRVPSPTTGMLQVTTQTSGESLDPDGFTLTVDGGSATTIPVNGITVISDIVPGTHTITLTGVSSNCVTAEVNSRTFSITAGVQLAFRFSVTCSFVGFTTWKAIPLPPSLQAGDLWGTSATDLFVSGRTEGASPRYGIWHYDGNGWTEQLSRVDTVFNRIWGFSGSDVYAVGNRASRESPHPGLIVHYDGSSWSDVPGPELGTGWTELWGLWGPSPDDLFVAGANYGTSQSEVVSHFDGQAWSGRMPTSGLGPQTRFADLSGTSSTDVWAIAYRYNTHDCETCYDVASTVARFDGHQWTNDLPEQSFIFFQAIWATAPNDVWVVARDDADLALLLHYDGTGWTWNETVNYNQPGLRDVWGSSPSDVYAVGPNVILHYDGSSWKRISSSGGNRVWGTSRDDVFVLRVDEILYGRP